MSFFCFLLHYSTSKLNVVLTPTLFKLFASDDNESFGDAKDNVQYLSSLKIYKFKIDRMVELLTILSIFFIVKSQLFSDSIDNLCGNRSISADFLLK